MLYASLGLSSRLDVWCSIMFSSTSLEAICLRALRENFLKCGVKGGFYNMP
jgi:hypothetical protein